MNDEDEFRAAAAASERMFWLDGGGARPWSGTRSVLGILDDDDVSLTFDAASRVVLRHQGGGTEAVGDDIFEALERQVGEDHGDPAVSWVGYFGYAARTDLPGRPAASGSPGHAAVPDAVPDAVWMRLRNPRPLPSRRHLRRREPSPPPVKTSRDDGSNRQKRRFDGYARAYDEVQRQLRDGNSYEVNLTYREAADSEVDPVEAYLRLRAGNPAPYSGYLQHHGTHLLSSSPERFATIDRDRWIEARPIKGTTPRGATPEEDEAHRRRLASDAKYRGENLMIVDLMRNDLSMVCEPGTVTVPALMAVESYRSVHQLVSTVRGRLRGEVTTMGALRALFPAGSMTGAPKLRTMQIIDAVEASPRGVYAGAFGWISGDGRADLSVVIRTLVATGTGPPWRYEWGTGGGVTVRSTLEDEYAETRWKADRLRAALDLE